MTARLRYFWFKSPQLEYRLGYGVTAWTEEDAVSLLREKVFGGDPLPDGLKMAADIDLSQLDRHVTPNMSPPIFRGIWFPQGYADNNNR